MFEKNFAIQCVRKEVDLRAYDWCVEEAEVMRGLETRLNPSERHLQKMNGDELRSYCAATF
jgi:hypothetical protein